MLNGLLLVDKPKGWTSFDVVAKVRGIIRSELRAQNPGLVMKVRVGHTGTLDPAATGLLMLAIGKATKRVPELIRHDKTYEAEMTLGITSSTGDQEGVMTPHTPQLPIGEGELRNVLEGFVGEQLQTPPAFSAIKVAGKRAYDLARAGKEVKLEPRPVTIHSIELNHYEWPIARIVCRVSSGTYIRSLVADIGHKLGCGAYMSELRRTSIGSYTIGDALTVDALNSARIAAHLIPLE